MAAREGGHEAGQVGMAAKRQRRQLEPHRPALGPFGQCGHRPEVEVRRDAAKQFRRLVEAEPEVGGAHLTQFTPAPVPGQAKGRIGTAGQHHAQLGRTVLEQEPDGRVHTFRTDQVVVVEDQQHVRQVWLGRDIVDQRADQRVVTRRRRWASQRPQPPGNARTRQVESGQHVAPEPYRVVVSLIEGQPGDRPGHVPGTLRQENRLAVTRRRGHQHQPAVQPVAELGRQPGARHQPRPRTRHVQLGGQQNVALGWRSVQMTACCRLSHR